MKITDPPLLFTGYIMHEAPRRLLFRWGSNPSVSWDWWIDPNSSTYLIREEFKHMNILTYYDRIPFNDCYDWGAVWPLWYPAWSDHYCPYPRDRSARSYWKLLKDRAHERANRRLRKKSEKAARAQGLKKRNPMPGAWPI